jgi:hypothetical protein
MFQWERRGLEEEDWKCPFSGAFIKISCTGKINNFTGVE